MAGFQTDILDHVARVVGGTVSGTTDNFYSGQQNGDGTGVTGLVGAFSQAPGSIHNTPVAIILPGPFSAELGFQGRETNEDELRILVLVAKYDFQAQIGTLTPYRDSVAAAFRAHMQAFAAPDVLDCFITAGTPGIHKWADLEYIGWDFTCRVRRILSSVTYVA